MDALRFRRYVNEEGIIIKKSELEDFKNMTVDVIIIPSSNYSKKSKKYFFEIAGKIYIDENAVNKLRDISVYDIGRY